MSKKNKDNFLMRLGNTGYSTPVVSKQSAVQAAVNLYTTVMEDGASAIEIAELFKFVETVYDNLKTLSDENGTNKFSDLVREEIMRNSDDGKSTITKFGTKFELMEAAGKFDFSTCGDPIWNSHYEDFVKAKEALEERQAYLKGLKKAVVLESIINPKTGEIHENVQIYPPVKNSTSTFKQTIL